MNTPQNSPDERAPGGLERAAAFFAARFPEFLAQSLTLGLGKTWYNTNGYFKFPVGAVIDCKGPEYFGYGLDPRSWRVTGHVRDQRTGQDRYEITLPSGEKEIHFKWNIENQFKAHDPEGKPFDPRRFTPESARNLKFG